MNIMYEFSMPLPRNINSIQEILKINKTYSEGQIKTFFFALPSNAPDRSTFEQIRLHDKNITCFENIENIIKESMDYGFKFIYLLNSVLGFSGQKDIYNNQISSLNRFLEKMLKAGCYNLRITNLELIDYIQQKYPEFNIYLSTSTEYTQLQQFQSVARYFPKIKEFIPSYEVNKDFHLLKNLGKNFPNIDIELICDEGCIPGCPLRIQHPIKKTILKTNPKEAMEIFDNISPLYGECYIYSDNNFYEYLCKLKVIYPWEIKEYGKIGVHKFKFVGRGVPFEQAQIKFYKYYLQGIEDPKSLDNLNINIFILRYRYSKTFHDSIDYKIKDIRKMLPDIKYFVNNGKDCHYKCGIDCRYCFNQAEKIRKFYSK